MRWPTERLLACALLLAGCGADRSEQAPTIESAPPPATAPPPAAGPAARAPEAEPETPRPAVSYPAPLHLGQGAASVEGLRKAAAQASTDPERLTALFIQSLAAYSLDPETGLEAVALFLAEDDLSVKDGARIPNRFRRDELRQLASHPELILGYCGGTRANNYDDAGVPRCTVTLDTEYSARRQGVGYPTADKAKFFVRHGGADLPRPVVLTRRDDGSWYVSTYGILSGVGRADQ